MAVEASLEGLVEALRRLPGVGVKSAQRMAYHLLQHDRDGARRIADSLQQAVARVRHCELCHTFTEQTRCSICVDARATDASCSSSRRRPIRQRSSAPAAIAASTSC